jgi:hypothetical protein
MEERSIDEVVEQNSAVLEDLVTALNSLDLPEYHRQSRDVRQVQNRMAKAKKLLRAGAELGQSDNYAALELLKAEGATRWKGVAYLLKMRYNVGADEFLEIVKENKGNPPSRLVYGTKGDHQYNMAKQLDLFTEGKG